MGLVNLPHPCLLTHTCPSPAPCLPAHPHLPLTCTCLPPTPAHSPAPASHTHVLPSSSTSTELRRWRLTCVTRARMLLPGKEPAPSLQRALLRTAVSTGGGRGEKDRDGGMGRGGLQGACLTGSIISRLEIPRRFSTFALASSSNPPEITERGSWRGLWRSAGATLGPAGLGAGAVGGQHGEPLARPSPVCAGPKGT